MNFTKIFILFCALITNIYGAKILGIFPFPSQSHQILGSALLKELAARGHEVTMIGPFPLKNPHKNYNDIFLEQVDVFKKEHMSQFINPNVTIYEKIKNFGSNMEAIVTFIFKNKNMEEFLNTDQKFDVVIQMWAFNEALLGIGHKFNATTIGFSVVGGNPWASFTTGNPSPYAYVPNILLGYTDNMNFVQRLINTVSNLLLELVHNFLNINFQKRILHEYFPNAPPLEDLIENVDLMLVNSHISTESARPYLPNVIQIGGFHLQEKETLPEELKEFLDKSKNGVIFFSLGSNLKSSDLSKEKLQGILKSFEKSKYDILWKFEENLPNKPKNVRISNWLPQKAVLGHPKIKAFITHGGLGGTVEAIYYGVPMICIPFFGDQQKNVADSVKNGYAIHLDLKDINENTLTNAINEITTNPKYKNNIMLRSDVFKNQEMNPMDKAVYWVEHVIKHKGAKHLKSIAGQIPWYKYMLLDVIAFLTLVIFISFWIVCFIFKKIYNIFVRIFRTKIKQN